MPTIPSDQPSLTVRIGLRLLTSILGLVVAQLIFSLTVGLAVVIPVPTVILPLGVIVGVITGFLTNRRVYRAVLARLTPQKNVTARAVVALVLNIALPLGALGLSLWVAVKTTPHLFIRLLRWMVPDPDQSGTTPS